MPSATRSRLIARPQVLLLDLDGPILDVRQRYFAAHERAAAGLTGVQAISREDFWEAKRQRRPLADILGLPAGHDSVARYQERWRDVIEADELLQLDVVQPGAREALARLDVVPERVLVSMRDNEVGVRRVLERLQLSRSFGRIAIIPHAIGSKVPAFRSCGTPDTPALTVVVGDTEVDIAAARALGFAAIAVSGGIRTGEFLHTLGADAVVSDLGAAAEIILGPA